ncbi:MAG: Hpt domain-containing protein [Gemmatimonadota bacterium]|nr:Hpt domain-containing protein [Gemmatimonadota bacterium]
MPEDVDPAGLERLRRLGGEALASKMVALFSELGEDRIAAARAAVADGDLETLERAAHSLKSSAGNVGAVRLQEQAQRVESGAERARDAGAGTAALEREIAEMANAFAAARDRLERETRGRSG